jgi:hypothetical protein
MDLYSAGTRLLNYAVKGGMLAAGAGMLIISIAIALGRLPQPPTERMIVVLTNYFLFGAVIGGLAGLVIILRQYRQDK